MSAATKTRKFVHVPFDSTKCPATGCDIEGSVPGVKRHYTRMHGDASKVTWPPIRTGERAAMFEAVKAADGNYEVLKADQLKALADARGIEDAHSMKKSELVAALS